MEDEIKSMHKQIKEAWDTYSMAQEKAAAREDELQDEIKQLAKAKQTDKQQLLLQMAKMNSDVEDALNQKKDLQKELETLQFKFEEIEAESNEWKNREHELEQELLDARASSVQGVETIRDDLQTSQVLIEQLRLDHSSLLRQSQIRQSELELANSQLSISLSDKQREVTRLHGLLEEAGKDPGSITREMNGLREHISQLSSTLEDERSRSSSSDRSATIMNLSRFWVANF